MRPRQHRHRPPRRRRDGWRGRPRAGAGPVASTPPAPSRAGDTAERATINLPTNLLRSFVAIVDTGSMLSATEQVYVTQSALSLQIKRLESAAFNTATRAGEHDARFLPMIYSSPDFLYFFVSAAVPSPFLQLVRQWAAPVVV